MTRDELKKKHALYSSFIAEWEFFGKVYDGGKSLIDVSLERNTRESWANFAVRVKEAFPMNYAGAIVDLFNFYLFEKSSNREIGKIANLDQWQLFEKDSDLEGTDFNKFMVDSQKLASVYGYVGIVVNKGGKGEIASVADEIKQGVYPYCVRYTPDNILDWKWEKNPISHRRRLAYLKLKEANDRYVLWYPEGWQIWEYDETRQAAPVCLDAGENVLGVIPFVIMRNITHLKYAEIGISDIKEIAYIVTSIVRNMSSGEEIIKYAGFPMFRRPKEIDTDDDSDDSTEAVIGLTAVQEFDPEMGEKGKPDWMPTEILEPVDAILKWTDRKTDEIYRLAHLSGVHGQRKSNNEVASGLALRYEYQQLNSVMIQKSANCNEAEMNIIKLWALWQKFGDETIQITRSKNFSIDDLAIDLDNTLKSMDNVLSRSFRVKVQKKIVKATLPDLSDKDSDEISTEIESNEPEVVVPSGLDGNKDGGEVDNRADDNFTIDD